MICSTADVLKYLGKASSATDAEYGLIALIQPLAEGALRDYIRYDPEYKLHIEFYPETNQYPSDNEETLETVGSRVVSGLGFSDQRIIRVRHHPLRSIVSIYEDHASRAGFSPNSSDFSVDTLLTQGVDYMPDINQDGFSDSGMIEKLNGSWSRRRRTVKIAYYSGYTAAEFDGTADSGIDAQGLKFAVLLAIVGAFQESLAWQGTGQTAGPLQSESISASGHSRTFAGQGISLTQGMMVSLPPKAKQLASKFRRNLL